MEQKVVYPAIYKHFKDKYYATMFISEPRDYEYINKQEQYMSVYHTEEDRQIGLYKINGVWYHTSINCSESLVIYKSLYDDEGPYARPVIMFMSEVDQEKYPNIKQQFRFELVK